MQMIEMLQNHGKTRMTDECHSRESGNPEEKEDVPSLSRE
jgi:hypothetical protein